MDNECGIEKTFNRLKFGKHCFNSVVDYIFSLGELHQDGLIYIHKFECILQLDGVYDIYVMMSIRDEEFSPTIKSKDGSHSIPIYNTTRIHFDRRTHSFMTEHDFIANDIKSRYNGMPYFTFRVIKE